MHLRFIRRSTSKETYLKTLIRKNQLENISQMAFSKKTFFQEVTITYRIMEFLLSLISYWYKLLMKDNYHKGNLENKISMVLFWIYLFVVGIMFTRGLILFVSK